jgi:hypothetical protein
MRPVEYELASGSLALSVMKLGWLLKEMVGLFSKYLKSAVESFV